MKRIKAIFLLASVFSLLVIFNNAYAADTTYPTLTITPSTATPAPGQTVTLTVTASDDVGLNNIAVFYRKTGMYGESGVECNDLNGVKTYTCLLSVQAGSVGDVIRYRAVVYDTSLNSANTPQQSDPNGNYYTITVVPSDSTPPTISVRNFPTFPTAGQTIVFEINAADNVGLSQIHYTEFYGTPRQGSGSGMFCEANGAKQYVCKVNRLINEGEVIQYRVSAYDIAGNKVSYPADNLPQQSLTTFSPDTAAPTGTVSHTPLSPAPGQTVAITVNANDDRELGRIDIYENGIIVKTCTFDGTPGLRQGSCLFSDVESVLGTYEYWAVLRDSSNNAVYIPAGRTNSFTVSDRSAPTVIVSGPSAALTPGQTATITATANDDIELKGIILYVNGGQVKSCPFSSVKTGTCTYTTNPLAPAKYTYAASAYDAQNTVWSAPAGEPAKAFVVGDSVVPTIKAAMSPANPQVGDTVIITVNVSDPVVSGMYRPSLGAQPVSYRYGGVDKVYIYDEKKYPLKLCSFNYAETGTCTFTKQYASGTYYYRVVANDQSNNYAYNPEPEGATKAFTVFQPADTTPPAVNVAYSPANPYTGQKVTITAAATDNYALSKILVYLDGSVKNTCTASGTSATCSYSAAFSAAGSHTYRAEVSDASGNSNLDPLAGTKSFAVIKDTTPPVVNVQFAPASVFAGQTATITATVTDNAGLSKVNIYFDGKVAKTCTPSWTMATCTYTTPAFTSTGQHSFSAEAFDLSNNKDADPQTGTKDFSVAVDSTLPTVTVNYEPRNPGPYFGGETRIVASATDNAALKKINIIVDGSVAKTCTVSGEQSTCTYKKTYVQSIRGIPQQNRHTYGAEAFDFSNNKNTDPLTGSKSFTLLPPRAQQPPKGGTQPGTSPSGGIIMFVKKFFWLDK